MCSATGGARRSRDVLSVQGLGVRQTSFVLPGPGAHTKGAPAGVTASAPRGVQLAPGAAAGPLVPDLGVSAEAMPRRIVGPAVTRNANNRMPTARRTRSRCIEVRWRLAFERRGDVDARLPEVVDRTEGAAAVPPVNPRRRAVLAMARSVAI